MTQTEFHIHELEWNESDLERATMSSLRSVAISPSGSTRAQLPMPVPDLKRHLRVQLLPIFTEYIQLLYCSIIVDKFLFLGNAPRHFLSSCPQVGSILTRASASVFIRSVCKPYGRVATNAPSSFRDHGYAFSQDTVSTWSANCSWVWAPLLVLSVVV